MQEGLSKVNRPSSDYTQVPNEVLYDTRFNEVSHGESARILLWYIFAKPDEWTFRTSVIASELGFSTSKLDRAIAAAKKLGYLRIDSTRLPLDSRGEKWTTESVWTVAIPEEAAANYRNLKLFWKTGEVQSPKIDSIRKLDENPRYGAGVAPDMVPGGVRNGALSKTVDKTYLKTEIREPGGSPLVEVLEGQGLDKGKDRGDASGENFAAEKAPYKVNATQNAIRYLGKLASSHYGYPRLAEAVDDYPEGLTVDELADCILGTDWSILDEEVPRLQQRGIGFAEAVLRTTGDYDPFGYVYSAPAALTTGEHGSPF